MQHFCAYLRFRLVSISQSRPHRRKPFCWHAQYGKRYSRVPISTAGRWGSPHSCLSLWRDSGQRREEEKPSLLLLSEWEENRICIFYAIECIFDEAGINPGLSNQTMLRALQVVSILRESGISLIFMAAVNLKKQENLLCPQPWLDLTLLLEFLSVPDSQHLFKWCWRLTLQPPFPASGAFLLCSPKCANSPCSHYALSMPPVLGTEWPLLFLLFAWEEVLLSP